MKYYHLTRLCFERNRSVLNKAFVAAEPGNVLSENWNFLSTECIVKAPQVDCVGPGVLATYDDPPSELVNSPRWVGKS